MGLQKITAQVRCDKCDAPFTVTINNDANTDGHATAFEMVVEALDFVEDQAHNILEAGHHDGEFYCPTCWTPKVEELFIADIKAGRIPAEHLTDDIAEYRKYLPQQALPAPSSA